MRSSQSGRGGEHTGAGGRDGGMWQEMSCWRGSDTPPHPPNQWPSYPQPEPPRRRKPKRRFPPEVLADAEVRLLMDACGTRTVTDTRNRALLAVLYRAGLRINEALCLRPVDVDPAAGMIRVMFGKGGTSRTVGIDPGGMAVIAEWVAVRATLGLPPRASLFCTKYGTPVTAASVRRLLPALAAKAGIVKRVHAHGLRHTHAAQLRSEGVDIGIISKQLGHVSITTTARYLDHIAPMAVVEVMRERRWASSGINQEVTR